MAEENPTHSVPGSVPGTVNVSPIGASGSADTEAAPRVYRNTNRRRNILIVIIVVVVLVVGGLFLWRYFSSYESTDDAQADVHLYPVSARISGYVVKVNVDDNQWV